MGSREILIVADHGHGDRDSGGASSRTSAWPSCAEQPTACTEKVSGFLVETQLAQFEGGVRGLQSSKWAN